MGGVGALGEVDPLFAVCLGKGGEGGYKPGMNETPQRILVPQDWHGKRLDQALELLLPDSGLRERKRAWERGAVLVDGRPRPKGYRVQAGQELSLREGGADEAQSPTVPDGVRVVGQKSGFVAAVYKPAGVHSAAIAGRTGLSVEGALGALWPGQKAVLVNRLDQPTSGLVLVALTPEARDFYRAAEDENRVRKSYLALVEGLVAGSLVLDRALDMDNRRLVRVLDTEGGPLRTTHVEPVRVFESAGTTLVRARIAKGARHQIRAHLAHAGHPIVGDAQYGHGNEGQPLYLHHGLVSLPGFEAKAVPEWAEWAEWGFGKSDL